MTIATTGYISSPFNLYLNPCTYLKTTLSNLSFTEFSVSLNEYNLSKKHGDVMHETNYVISDEYIHNMNHT